MKPPEIVEENPYPTQLLNYLDYVAVQGMRVFKVPMDITVSCLYLTTPEKQQWYCYIHRAVLIFPLAFLCMVLTMPINIAAFFLWLLIHERRKPYRLSYCGRTDKLSRPLTLKTTYGFLTTNVCLMPECMGRFNNFSGSWRRCERMGQILARTHVPSDSHSVAMEMDAEEILMRGQVNTGTRYNSKDSRTMCGPVATNNNSNDILGNTLEDISLADVELCTGVHGHAQWNSPPEAPLPDFDVSVLEFMPNTDFILLQEASWDMEYAKTLVKELHGQYPYVTYDIGMHSLKGNLYVGNSGLMLASKYNILELRFGLFTSSCSPCRFASKGLLQLKVFLGRSTTGQDVVGYVFNTHLQAYKGDRPIQTEQMDDIMVWTRDFRRSTHKRGEIVAFDILGGDFNLDNMSPADEKAYCHPLFDKYIDIGRERKGKDHHWTKGTELRQLLLYEPALCSAACLRRVLDDPVLMQTYLLDGDLEYSSLEMASSLARRDSNGQIAQSPVGGKRRIDYVMFNSVDKHLRVTSFNPVTALHSLTDHVPVYMSVNVARHPDLSSDFCE